MTRELVEGVLGEVLEGIRASVGEERFTAGYEAAGELFTQLSTAESCADFLTLPAYENLLTLRAAV